MSNIIEKKHISVIISSLEKSYNRAKLGKQFLSKKIYILDILYNILNSNIILLTEKERLKINELYNTLYFNNPDEICNHEECDNYNLINSKFIEAEAEDCNTYPEFNKIFYWQEDNISTVLEDIQILVDDTDYLDNKSYDTFENFELGKEIEYTNTGRISFLAMESDTINYKVYDIYNNDITNMFDIVLIPTINSTLIVSKNYYSYGNINFKIKKL